VQGNYYAQVVVADDGANSEYDGLLASVQHRFSQNYTLLANYTWSHCISDGDFQGNVGNPQYQNQAIPAGRAADRSNCDFDVRHLFNASFVGIVPSLPNAWASRILSGWQFAPLFRVQSGLPVNVLTGTDNSLTGDNLDRPNGVPNVARYAAHMGSTHQWFNPASVTPNPTGTFGNLGREAFRAPGQFNFDVSLSRVIPLAHERLQLEPRVDAFNAINHPNYLAPVAKVNSANFGQLTSANDPRILQFSLKVHY
jgi:hypothetical protein